MKMTTRIWVRHHFHPHACLLLYRDFDGHLSFPDGMLVQLETERFQMYGITSTVDGGPSLVAFEGRLDYELMPLRGGPRVADHLINNEGWSVGGLEADELPGRYRKDNEDDPDEKLGEGEQ